MCLLTYLLTYGASQVSEWNLPAHTGDAGLILSQEDPLKKEMATQLQYSCLEKPMGRGDWWATVHRIAKSWT